MSSRTLIRLSFLTDFIRLTNLTSFGHLQNLENLDISYNEIDSLQRKDLELFVSLTLTFLRQNSAAFATFESFALMVTV